MKRALTIVPNEVKRFKKQRTESEFVDTLTRETGYKINYKNRLGMHMTSDGTLCVFRFVWDDENETMVEEELNKFYTKGHFVVFVRERDFVNKPDDKHLYEVCWQYTGEGIE